MSSNGTQQGDNVPSVNDGASDAGSDAGAVGLRSEYLTSLQATDLTSGSSQRVEPDTLNTGNIWGDLGLGGRPNNAAGDMQTAMLPRDQQRRSDNIFEIPDNPNDQKISKDVDADLAKNKAVNEAVIKMGSDLIHAAVKEGNPKALAAEFAALVSNMNTFQNSGLDNGLRADALTAARLSAATLNQFSETISNESRDGQPVDIKFDAKEKSMSITIGNTTMNINSRGMVEMQGVQMTPQEFLKKLKPASGGRDMV